MQVAVSSLVFVKSILFQFKEVQGFTELTVLVFCHIISEKMEIVPPRH